MANFTIPQQTMGEFAPSQSTVPNQQQNPIINRDIDLTNDILQQDIMQKTLQIADL